MNLESCLSSILPAYKEFRKKSIDKFWFSYKSYILRSLGSTNEFTRLLSEEAKHYQEAREWISGYLKLNKIENERDLDYLISFLKSFKERSGFRGGFLIIIAAFAAAISPISGIPYFSVLVALPLLIVFFERHYLNLYASYANDLVFLLEQKKVELKSVS